MKVLRTPEERFAALPGYDHEPRYLEVGDGLRMNYVDEGDAGAPVVLLLHGEPTWSYLYRTMIPIIAAAGLRAVAPDLIGFGRSDKPAQPEDYSYRRHMDWLHEFVAGLDLGEITLFGQDWGGLLGLRLIAEAPQRFASAVVSNTFLPTGDQPLGDAFFRWRDYSQSVETLPIGWLIDRGCTTDLPADVLAAYEAPFPDESFKIGARVFPTLVPATPDDPAATDNRAAWEFLASWERPFLTAFGDSDPITRGADWIFQAIIPGAEGQPHTTLENGGHYIQEDKGEELASLIVDFLSA